MDEQRAAMGHAARAWEWFTGTVALSAVAVGRELGLFAYLSAHGAAEPARIAEALGLQARPVETWARVLVAEGLLDAAPGETVVLAPGTRMLLGEPPSLLDLGAAVEFHARFLARDFLDLPAFFVDGVPRDPARHGPALSSCIAAQTAAMQQVFATAIVPALPRLVHILRAGGRILDGGCGAGGLSVALATAYPGARFVGVDRDAAAVALGQQRAAVAGVTDRVELREGDLADAPQENHDAAVLFQVLHEIPPGNRAAVFRSLARSLRPGGLLVLLDEYYPESPGDARERRARTGVHWDYSEMLWGSRVATRAEAEETVLGAGFTGLEWIAVLEGNMNVLTAVIG